MITEVRSEHEMKALGKKLGALLAGGEVLELVGDVGAGKTTLTKGVAEGMGIEDDVQSPSFTINRLYDTPGGVRLAHYDFYRLQDAGIMAAELRETLHDSSSATIIEWGEIVNGVLPEDRLTITITSPSEEMRRLDIRAGGGRSGNLMEQLI